MEEIGSLSVSIEDRHPPAPLRAFIDFIQSTGPPSPLLASIYLVCGLLRVDVADAQRFGLKWAVATSLIATAAVLLIGAFPLSGDGVAVALPSK
ncbi:MAG TPA: hypothetical protein VGE08_06220 [Steroidobacter sp.]|uniref:hypothetical protein n=1 Tax=Steroidobacter sp. TaxID=1978227 RepID=UPI002ED9F0C2